MDRGERKVKLIPSRRKRELRRLYRKAAMIPATAAARF